MGWRTQQRLESVVARLKCSRRSPQSFLMLMAYDAAVFTSQMVSHFQEYRPLLAVAPLNNPR